MIETTDSPSQGADEDMRDPKKAHNDGKIPIEKLLLQMCSDFFKN
jgi:hypothetical protein